MPFVKCLRFLSLVACLVLLFTAAAWTQIVSGSIGGTVLDSSRAAISSAQVALVNQDTGLTRETTSNEMGSFLFLTLPPGKYRVSAAAPGFKSVVVSDIDLQIDQTVALEVALEVGAITESIKVEASAVTLQTETATVGQVIAERPIVDLPLNGRNFLQLAILSAGVVPATATTSEAARLGRPETTVHVAGGRASFSSYLIDGQEARGSRFGEATFLPNPDVILEFKIQRNFYSAEYGSSPAIVSLSVKSGTNIFHGSLYEFFRNSALDQPQYFDNGSPPPFRLNQFGGTIGGPIRSNRTFFFVGYEGRRQRLATQAFAILPAPALLAGDFSSLKTAIKDPFNNGAPFQGNMIPLNRINSIALNFNKFIPTPNASTTQGNYTGAPSATSDFDQYHIRGDHRFSERDSIFGRFSKSDWSENTPGLLPFRGVNYPLNGRNVVVEETHIFNPGFLNTLKLGYTRGFLASDLQSASQNLAAQIGFQNLVVDPIDYGLPRFQLTGYTQMGHSINTFRNWTNTYALSDTVNLIRGRHAMAFGADIRENRVPQATTNGSNGRLTFDGRFTGNPVADYLLGSYSAASGFSSGVIGDFRYSQYALFFQDNYKVSDRLSLNLGLRWEYNQPLRELGGSEGTFDLSIPGLRLAKDPSIYGVVVKSPFIQVGGLRDGVVRPQFLNFAPRLGFAYKITNKTVVRGGLGIFYAMDQQNDLIALSSNPGASVTTNYTNSPGTIPRLDSTLFDRVSSAGLPPSTQLSVVDPNRKTPYMEQVSLDIQRELPGNLFFEVGYIGNEGHQLVGRQELNQAVLNAPGQNLPVAARRPFPMFASVWQFFGGENSNYNGMTLSLERRFTGGIGFLANYTFSRAMDAYSSAITDYSTPHHISSNRHLDYGRSAFDVRNRFAGNVSYELPFGKGKRFLANASGVTNWVVSGWQINSIIQLQSGIPFGVFLISDRSNTGTIAQQRPNRVANGSLPPDQRTPSRWFDTSAFQLNPANTYGNSGRDILDQNGVKTTDLSVLKNSHLTEKLTMQFRAELFNLLNSDNFGPPGTFLDGPNFGIVTTVGPARQVQFGLKLLF